MGLDFKIAHRDGVSVVSMTGRIMSETDVENIQAFLNSGDDISSNLIFDMSGMSHINSNGINFIMRTLTRTRINQGDLVISGVEGNVRTLFEIAKINEILTIYNTVSEAVDHFNNN